MTIDEVIERLREERNARGGDAVVHVVDWSGYETERVPANYVGTHWLYENIFGIWS